MKVRKIKNKKLVKKTLYAILLMLIGAYLHKVSTPNIKANWNADNTPYVLTRHFPKQTFHLKKNT